MKYSTKTSTLFTRNGSKQKNRLRTASTFALAIMTIALFSFSSCQPAYPDGPLISLVSRTDRVTNNWKVGQAIDNGTDVTTNYDQYELNLTKAGAASLTAKYTVLGVNFNFTTNGTWTFIDNQAKLSFDFDNNAADGVYQILKLTQTEMWLKEDAGTVELHLVPQ